MTAASTISICVCTYRRAHIVKTLASLSHQIAVSGFRLEIVVADNDDEPTAKQPIIDAARSCPFPIRYVHSPAGNISIARNACLDAAAGDFCAFIDDDELATPQWLTELIGTATTSGAAVVLGPVRAVYGAEAPGWMRSGDFHSTFPVTVNGTIRTGYTCNVLLDRRNGPLRQLRFDLARGRSGGEDTDFFTRYHQAGGEIAYAPNAWVTEPVTLPRARFSWLSRRRFRMGQTHGNLIAAGQGRLGVLKELALAGAKACYCFVMTALTMAFATRSRHNALRGMLHVGVISGLLGVQEIVQYGTQAES